MITVKVNDTLPTGKFAYIPWTKDLENKVCISYVGEGRAVSKSDHSSSLHVEPVRKKLSTARGVRDDVTNQLLR